MARIFTSGAESASTLTEAVGTSGTVTFDTTTKRSGTRAYKHDSAANAVAWVQNQVGSGLSTQYFRTYLNFAAWPDGSNILSVLYGTVSVGASLRHISTSGLVAAYDKSNFTGNAYQLSLNTWYRIEFAVTTGVGATDGLIVRITPDGGTTTELC